MSELTTLPCICEVFERLGGEVEALRFLFNEGYEEVAHAFDVRRGSQKMGSGRCLLVFRYLFRIWAKAAFPLKSIRWLWRSKGGWTSFVAFGLELVKQRVSLLSSDLHIIRFARQ